MAILNGKSKVETVDPNAMSIEELQAIIDQKKQAKAALVRERAMGAKKELEAYCLKTYGIPLQSVFTASDKPPVTYKHPTTGDTYSGRGKKPSWLKGHEAEYAIQ